MEEARGQRVSKIAVHLLILAFCGFWVYFYQLGTLGLLEPDEPRYAESAREMLQQHEWLVPQLNFQPRLEKPPLFYWLMMLSYKAFGISEASARLPSALFAFLSLFLCYFIGRLLFNPHTALLAGFILSACFLYLTVARLAITDMMLNFWLLAGICIFLWGYVKRKRYAFLGVYLTLALGVFTKGPVAFTIPGLVIGSFLFLYQKRSFRLLPLSMGILIILAVVLPWSVLLEKAEPGILKYYLFDETLGRFFTGEYEREQPLYFMTLVLLAGGLPWSLLLFPAGRRFYRALRQYTSARETLTFLWLWLCVPLLFFMISKSQLPTYITPLFVPLSLLCAWELSQEQTRRAGGWLLVGLLPLLLLLGVFIYLGIFCLRCRYGLELNPLMLIPPLLALAAFIASYVTGRRTWWVPLLIAGYLSLVIFVLPSVARVGEHKRSIKSLCEDVRPYAQKADRIVFFRTRIRHGANFYLQRPLIETEEVEELLTWAKREERLLVFGREGRDQELNQQFRRLGEWERLRVYWMAAP